jgi:hypothetical protein
MKAAPKPIRWAQIANRVPNPMKELLPVYRNSLLSTQRSQAKNSSSRCERENLPTIPEVQNQKTFASALQRKIMNYALIIPDGVADEPQENLGGRTPLAAATLPHARY